MEIIVALYHVYHRKEKNIGSKTSWRYFSVLASSVNDSEGNCTSSSSKISSLRQILVRLTVLSEKIG